MKRFLIFSPLFLIFLTGCPEKDQIDNMTQSELEKLDQCIEVKKAEGLPISGCGIDLKKSNEKKPRQSNFVDSLNTDKDRKEGSFNSNQNIKQKEPTGSNRELDKIDECIKRKKAKKQPYFDCLQK
tara:strand:+ start:74 stop:451 length:378 start_codon:yes stop_codon:yes gene_type:complete